MYATEAVHVRTVVAANRPDFQCKKLRDEKTYTSKVSDDVSGNRSESGNGNQKF